MNDLQEAVSAMANMKAERQMLVWPRRFMKSWTYNFEHDMARMMGVDMASKGQSKSTLMIYDNIPGKGKVTSNIGESQGEQNMSYQDECTQTATDNAKRLSPVIEALVNYAERTGRAEAQVHFVTRDARRAQDKAENFQEAAECAKDRSARLERDLEYYVAQSQKLANELNRRDQVEARKKAAAKKAKKPAAKKTTAKKSK